jgi:hypothetical protein
MVRAIGARWRIEEDFQTGKDTGLDHYEVRSFIGWYRHITLVLLALAFLKVICKQEQETSDTTKSSPIPRPLLASAKSASPPVLPPTPPTLAPLTVPEVRHLLGHLIWPSARQGSLVLGWSKWRRRHRDVAIYYHTKRRLEAG